MGFAAVAAGIGGAVNIGGKIKANLDQAAVERLNQKFFNEQAEHSEKQQARQLDIFDRESGQLLGAQTTAFAAAGVDMRGSPMLQIEETKGLISKQRVAIEEEGAIRTKLALLKARTSGKTAATLSSFGTNFLGSVGTVGSTIGTIRSLTS